MEKDLEKEEEVLHEDLDGDKEEGESKEHKEKVEDKDENGEVSEEEKEEIEGSKEELDEEEDVDEEFEAELEASDEDKLDLDVVFDGLENDVNAIKANHEKSVQECARLQEENEQLKVKVLELEQRIHEIEIENLFNEFPIKGSAYELVKSHLNGKENKREIYLNLQRDIPELFLEVIK